MFVFDICQYHINGPGGNEEYAPDPSPLYVSIVYDILLKQDRDCLLDVLAKLAVFQQSG